MKRVGSEEQEENRREEPEKVPLPQCQVHIATPSLEPPPFFVYCFKGNVIGLSVGKAMTML
jgi:hypothetical protein